ncbi:MAG: hypothetical protein SF051_14320 [Elusimicrobiota bacterium]|nr:hypothetical protein [Elusimicrobiota bacterium]
MKLLLSAALLTFAALPAASEPLTGSGSAADACSSGTGFEGRAMVLWATDKTNPDEAPCLARLSYARCEAEMADDAAIPTGYARRFFSGRGVAAVYEVSPEGAVTVTLNFAGALGINSGVSRLGTYPYQRAVYRGIGVDKASAYDLDARASRPIGNVFLIPAENLTERALAQCPADR